MVILKTKKLFRNYVSERFWADFGASKSLQNGRKSPLGTANMMTASSQAQRAPLEAPKTAQNGGLGPLPGRPEICKKRENLYPYRWIWLPRFAPTGTARSWALWACTGRSRQVRTTCTPAASWPMCGTKLRSHAAVQTSCGT